MEKARDLYERMSQGQTMEVFEQYYHPNVRVIEVPTNEVREGKEAQRKAIEGWYNQVEEQHGGGVGAITANEEDGITTVESWMDITFKEGGRMKMEEVAVQKWQDGQIIEEKFYYNMPGQ